MNEEQEYDAYLAELRQRFPKMFPEGHSDVWVGEGWRPIVINLCAHIQSHIDAVESRIEYYKNKGDEDVYIPPVKQVVVAQIKEKFGGLRFYYDGGDDYIRGLESMAESWAANTCEVCGERGRNRTDLSWHKTLCDHHYQQRKQDMELHDGSID